MTVVHMSEKGQITVPKEARDKRGLSCGSTLLFIETARGDLLFRPIKKVPEKDLVDYLDELQGLDLETGDRKHHCPPRV
jgi:AbrB family looped-hinge helix DNA binding protein